MQKRICAKEPHLTLRVQIALFELTSAAEALTAHGTSKQMLSINSKAIVFEQNTEYDVKMHVKKDVFFLGGFCLSGGDRAGPRLSVGARAGSIWTQM